MDQQRTTDRRDLFARTWRLTGTGYPDEHTLTDIVEVMVPQLSAMAGYAGGSVLVDRQRGDILATTYWETLEDLRAAQARAELAAAATQVLAGALDVEVHVCDVLVSEPPPAHRGTHLFGG